MKPVETTGVIWQKCFKEKACVKIPFDGTHCLEAKGCVRIIKSGESYFVEIELFGNRVRYELAKTCYPAYSVGIARIEVCADPKLDNNRKLKGVTISANLCVGGKIDGIKLEKCWKVIRTNINFFHLNDLDRNFVDAMHIESPEMLHNIERHGQEYVYVEYDELAEALNVDKPIMHGEFD